MRRYKYKPVLHVICKHPRHSGEWRVTGTWKEHLQRYLRSPEEIHARMRQIGVDWFHAEPAGEPHSDARRENISKGMLQGRVWNRGLKTGIQHHRAPNTKQWWIVTTTGEYTVTNLAKWIADNNLSKDAIKTRIKRQRWPYLNILRIVQWGKK